MGGGLQSRRRVQGARRRPDVRRPARSGGANDRPERVATVVLRRHDGRMRAKFRRRAAAASHQSTGCRDRLATEAARAIASPYATIDVSERSGGGWFCLEAGDGGVSGPALDQDVLKLWKDLRACFAAEDAPYR